MCTVKLFSRPKQSFLVVRGELKPLHLFQFHEMYTSHYYLTVAEECFFAKPHCWRCARTALFFVFFSFLFFCLFSGGISDSLAGAPCSVFPCAGLRSQSSASDHHSLLYPSPPVMLYPSPPVMLYPSPPVMLYSSPPVTDGCYRRRHCWLNNV